MWKKSPLKKVYGAILGSTGAIYIVVVVDKLIVRNGGGDFCKVCQNVASLNIFLGMMMAASMNTYLPHLLWNYN